MSGLSYVRIFQKRRLRVAKLSCVRASRNKPGKRVIKSFENTDLRRFGNKLLNLKPMS